MGITSQTTYKRSSFLVEQLFVEICSIEKQRISLHRVGRHDEKHSGYPQNYMPEHTQVQIRVDFVLFLKALKRLQLLREKKKMERVEFEIGCFHIRFHPHTKLLKCLYITSKS